MNFYYISMLLIIGSNIIYHISQKSIPEGANPMASLVVTYGSALLVSLILLIVYPGRPGVTASFKGINWASVLLGLSVVGLETGFLLAYRSGWDISLAALFANVNVSILLIPVGILAFKEHISTRSILGIILSILGIILIAKK